MGSLPLGNARRLVYGVCHRHSEEESAAFVRFTLDPGLSTPMHRYLFADGQPQPGPGRPVGKGRFGLLKPVEYPAVLGYGYAQSVV